MAAAPARSGKLSRVAFDDTHLPPRILGVRLPPSEMRSQAAIRLSLIAALIAGGIGLVVLCGWVWQNALLTSAFGSITMKANAAVAMLACGLALAGVRRFPLFARLCAAVVTLLGTLTFAEHLTGVDLGIDQLLFVEAPGALATASPNRLGVNASIGFTLAGIALWNLAAHTVATARRAQILAVVGLLLGAVPTAGYLYGAEQLYGLARFTGIALHTAVAFVVLNIGIFTARPMVGPASVFLSEGPAGTMLRRLALPIIVIPLALGYAEIGARANELVDRGLGIALYAVALIAVLGMTVWITARDIDDSDQERRLTALQRDQLVVREQKARHDAERANQLKDQFLATLSHELRTPLNVMLGSLRQLQQDAPADDRMRIVGRVARNGQLLARLVEDMLDLSRITAGQFDIHTATVNLNTVVRSAIDTLTPTAAAAAVTIHTSLAELAPIEADGRRLLQIVVNLLSNAVKFTPAGGEVTVTTAGTADNVTVTIVDTGQGFDEAFAAELFQPFRQADASLRREHGGLGLGLSIARHLATLHGGTVTGRSDGAGRGAAFTLTLPRRTAHQVA